MFSVQEFLDEHKKRFYIDEELIYLKELKEQEKKHQKAQGVPKKFINEDEE